MELTEEQKAYRKESLELLKQSNDADYASTLEKIDKKAMFHVTPDTPIKYVTGRYCGWEGIGLILCGVIETSISMVLLRFDLPMRTQKVGGEVHASVDVSAIKKNMFKLRDTQGEFVILETTVGDKETFCKIVNNMWDIADHRGYLVKDPRELLCKPEKIDPNMEPELDEFGHPVHYVARCAPGTHLGEYHEVWARFWKTPGGKWDVCVYKMKFEDGHVVEWEK